MCSKINSITLYPKSDKIPTRLIYKTPKNDLYRMVDSRSGKMLGEMLAFVNTNTDKCFYTNLELPYKSFHIASLEIVDKNKGYGREFIDFAKVLSKRNGCENRLTLEAYNSGKSPHIFYKKCGFTTNYKHINKFLDKCIAKKEQVDYMPLVHMYIA